MKKILLLILGFSPVLLFSQVVIRGGAGICHVSGNPNSVADLGTQDISYGCHVAIDTSNGTRIWYYKHDGAPGSKWILATFATGSVSSVGLSLPSELFTISNSPVTSSGTLTGTFQTKAANQIFAGPASGAAAAPTFRGMVRADLPDTIVSYAKIQNIDAYSVIGRSASTAGVSGAITADDHEVLRRSGTTLEFGAIALNQSAAVTGTLPVNNGGTGLSGTYTNGELLIGNGTGLTKATLTQGTGMSITNTAGAINVAVATNGISNTLFRKSVGLSVVGNSTNATADVADIIANTAGHILRRDGTTLGFGSLDLKVAASTTTVSGKNPTDVPTVASGGYFYTTSNNTMGLPPGTLVRKP